MGQHMDKAKSDLEVHKYQAEGQQRQWVVD